MKELAIRLREAEQGMTTTEYAVGTVAVASFAGLLVKLLTSPEVQALVFKVLQYAFELVLG